MKKKILVLAVVCIGLIIASMVIIVKRHSSTGFKEINPDGSSFVTGGDIDERSKTYDKYGSSGGYTPLVLNVSSCQKGGDSAYFGLGHTEFLVEGKKGSTCVFKYGTDVESPSWDGKLDTVCAVPNSQTVKLTVGDQGIDFTPIKQHCSGS